VANRSSLGHAIHPSSGCMPQEWLKERNLFDVADLSDDADDEDDDDEEEEDEEDPDEVDVCEGLFELPRMAPQRSNNIMCELFINLHEEDESELEDVCEYEAQQVVSQVHKKAAEGGVPGYIEHFDLSSTSTETDEDQWEGDEADGVGGDHSDSESVSIEVQAAFDLIGFRSPPKEMMAALEYASSASEWSRDGDGSVDFSEHVEDAEEPPMEPSEVEGLLLEEQFEGIDIALSCLRRDNFDLMDAECAPQFVKKPLMVKYTPYACAVKPCTSSRDSFAPVSLIA